jgi:hypothetical protein
MPISISKANRYNRNEVEKIKLDFGEDGDLNMEVLPNKFTKGFQRQIRDHISDKDVVSAFDLFLEVVVSWDMLGEDGKTLPLTPEATDELTIMTLNQIITKMMEVVSPNSETSTGSEDGSSIRTLPRRKSKTA